MIPFDEEELAYILRLDAAKDVEFLRRVLPWLPEGSLRTLQVRLSYNPTSSKCYSSTCCPSAVLVSQQPDRLTAGNRQLEASANHLDRQSEPVGQ